MLINVAMQECGFTKLVYRVAQGCSSTFGFAEMMCESASVPIIYRYPPPPRCDRTAVLPGVQNSRGCIMRLHHSGRYRAQLERYSPPIKTTICRGRRPFLDVTPIFINCRVIVIS